MRTRNKIILFAVLPLAIVSWIIGWNLYWAGDRKRQWAHRKAERERATLAFAVVEPEKKCLPLQ